MFRTVRCRRNNSCMNAEHLSNHITKERQRAFASSVGLHTTITSMESNNPHRHRPKPEPNFSEAFRRTPHGLSLFPIHRSQTHRHYLLRPLRAVRVTAETPQQFLWSTRSLPSGILRQYLVECAWCCVLLWNRQIGNCRPEIGPDPGFSRPLSCVFLVSCWCTTWRYR